MEKIPDQSSQNPNRRNFIKSVAKSIAFTGAAAAGLGEAPFQVAKSEIKGNKERQNNAVTVTLENDKKVSLVLGAHTAEFSEGQTIPQSEILGIEVTHDLLDEITRNLSNLTKRNNNAPVIREMMRGGKYLYQCDVQLSKTITQDRREKMANAGSDDTVVTGYLILAVLSALPATYLAFAKTKNSRREFLGNLLATFGYGISSRSVASISSSLALENPNELTPLDQILQKYTELHSFSKVGSIFSQLTSAEKFEVEKIVSLLRSVIMALKLRSALRLSDAQSITMTLGAAHVLTEDFVTMTEEDLIKKLEPFKESLKNYFDLESLFKMTKAYFDDKTSEVRVNEEEDPLLRKLVEKHLLK